MYRTVSIAPGGSHYRIPCVVANSTDRQGCLISRQHYLPTNSARMILRAWSHVRDSESDRVEPS